MEKGCHKVLEYLIRFYKVEKIFGELLSTILLPFHETKYYARLLQILKLDKNFWLAKHASQGLVVQRSWVEKKLTDPTVS
jgi:hypothetical protein